MKVQQIYSLIFNTSIYNAFFMEDEIYYKHFVLYYSSYLCMIWKKKTMAGEVAA